MSEYTKGDLKPCPFCGGEVSIGTVKYSPCDITKLNDREKGYFVNCQICSARNEHGISYATEEEAVKHWNTRNLEDDLLKACEATAKIKRMVTHDSSYVSCRNKIKEAFDIVEAALAKAQPQSES